MKNATQVREKGSQTAPLPQSKPAGTIPADTEPLNYAPSLENINEAIDSAIALIRLMERVIVERDFNPASAQSTSLQTLCLQGINAKSHSVIAWLNESRDYIEADWLKLENALISERARGKRSAERSAAK